jgi:hypothetical protein
MPLLRLLEKLGGFDKLAKCQNGETLLKLYESLIKKLAKFWRKAKSDETFYKYRNCQNLAETIIKL